MRIPQIISPGLRGEGGRKTVWCSHGNKWRRKELWHPGSLQSGEGRQKHWVREDEGSRQQGEAPGTQHGWVPSESMLSHSLWRRTVRLIPCSEPRSCIFYLSPCCGAPVACLGGVRRGRGLWFGSSGHMRDVLGRSPTPQTSLQMV